MLERMILTPSPVKKEEGGFSFKSECSLRFLLLSPVWPGGLA